MAKDPYAFAMFTPAGRCMMNCMGGPCGMTSTVVKVDNDTFYTPNTICCCIPMGGCPCFPCCGFGPLEFAPQWKRDPKNPAKFVGTGPVYKGRCCAMMNNNDDVQFTNDDGTFTFIPYSALTPPCFTKGVPLGMAVPIPAPGSAAMQRYQA